MPQHCPKVKSSSESNSTSPFSVRGIRRNAKQTIDAGSSHQWKRQRFLNGRQKIISVIYGSLSSFLVFVRQQCRGALGSLLLWADQSGTERGLSDGQASTKQAEAGSRSGSPNSRSERGFLPVWIPAVQPAADGLPTHSALAIHAHLSSGQAQDMPAYHHEYTSTSIASTTETAQSITTLSFTRCHKS